MACTDGLFLGIAEGHVDPAVAIVSGGQVLAYAEEERFIRFKHAPQIYPGKALQYCLRTVGATISDVKAVSLNWDAPSYTDGTIAAFYQRRMADNDTDPGTVHWQNETLHRYNTTRLRDHHYFHWRGLFGEREFPPLVFFPHHFIHALHAGQQSRFDDALVLTLDGSGDTHCSVMWVYTGGTLRPIREVLIPHSLGWLYAAFTEYMGFAAYDGEYKVMGMAGYGKPRRELSTGVRAILASPLADGTYTVDPRFIHQGPHSYSGRFTDHLPAHFGHPPRRPDEPVTQWHLDLAFAVQCELHRAVESLLRAGIDETGLHDVCLAGGVAHNVKLNSHLFSLDVVNDVFPQPLCSDGGAAVGAALAAWNAEVHGRAQPLTSLALGPEEDGVAIREAFTRARVDFVESSDICRQVACELAAGRIVGWFQGRLEAGPRALGQRSILADPRQIQARDLVNQIVKGREEWRPLCPSIPLRFMDWYFEKWTESPFMTIAFRANERLMREAPAIVHVDGTVRVQTVTETANARFHNLLLRFYALTGVPVLLNTSFNMAGEPIVGSVRDALRTFWSTGLEVLAAGDVLVYKPQVRPATSAT